MQTSIAEPLVVRAQGGDERAFVALYDELAPMLARRLRRVLGRPDEVEDVLQNTFLEVHRSIRRYRPEKPFAAWVNRIATHVMLRHLRARGRRWWQRQASDWEIESATDGRRAGVEEQAFCSQMTARLYAAMDRLPPKKRIAFALVELEEMGVTEIGEMVGASPQTVWARVNSARKQLQEELADLRPEYLEQARRDTEG